MAKAEYEHWVPRTYLEGFFSDTGTYLWAADLPCLCRKPSSQDALNWHQRGATQVCRAKRYHREKTHDAAIDGLVNAASNALSVIRTSHSSATLEELLGSEDSAAALLRMLLAHRFRNPLCHPSRFDLEALAYCVGSPEILPGLETASEHNSRVLREEEFQRGLLKRRVHDTLKEAITEFFEPRTLAFDSRIVGSGRADLYDDCLSRFGDAPVYPSTFWVEFVPDGTVWTTDHPFRGLWPSGDDSFPVPLSRHHWLVGSNMADFVPEDAKIWFPRLSGGRAVFSPVATEFSVLGYEWIDLSGEHQAQAEVPRSPWRATAPAVYEDTDAEEQEFLRRHHESENT